MRFVVAGAGGYVGRFLCKRLIDCGHDVTAISRTGVAIEGVTNLRHDLSKAGDIHQFPDRCDVVVNLVAQSNLGGASDYFEINRDIPARLVQEAIRHGVGRVIHISTIGVHGVSTKGREDFSEADRPSPVAGDIYAISKLAGEQSLMEACGGGGATEYTILRPPAVYGPGATTFGKLVRLVKSGLPLPVAGIRNANSYLGVHNLVDAIITCATTPRAANETFVLSDGLKLSTPGLARQIAETLGIASRQFYWPESLFPIPALKSSLALNNNKIVTRLNWSPPVSFRDGLKELIEAFP